MVTPLARKAGVILTDRVFCRAEPSVGPATSARIVTGPLNGLEFVQHRFQRDLVRADERFAVRRAAQGVE